MKTRKVELLLSSNNNIDDNYLEKSSTSIAGENAVMFAR